MRRSEVVAQRGYKCEWLRGIYPAVARAARYIIAQEDARGLVCCSANDPCGSVWAIASWRNIIPRPWPGPPAR